MIKNALAMQEPWVQFLGQKDPLEKGILPTPVFLPGKPHEQRSLEGYSPWCHRELDIHMPVCPGMCRPAKFSHVTTLTLYWDKLPTT